MQLPTKCRRLYSCEHCEHRSERMFCNLSHDELADFDSIGVQMKLPKGAVIFQEGDSSHSIAVLCEGQVKLASTSREGKTLILKIAMPGDVLGLGAVVSGSCYEVTAEAIEPATIKSIRKDEFLSFLNRHGQASMHAAKALSEDYKSTFFDAQRLALAPSAAGRLASVLLELGRRAARGPEMTFVMALTHEELANLAGTSRETVTRMLSRFKRERLLRIRGSVITILDPTRLMQLAS